MTRSGRSVPSSTRPIRRLAADTRGLATVELVLLICLIAIVGLAAWSGLGRTLRSRVDGAIAVLDEQGAARGPSAAGSSGSGGSRSGSSGGAASGGAGPSSGSTRASGAGDERPAGIARGVRDGLVEVVTGAVEGAVAIGGVALGAIRDPGRVQGAVAAAAADPAGTVRAIADGAASAAGALAEGAADWQRRFADGDAYTRARMLTMVGASVVPVGTVGTVARGAGAAVRMGSASSRTLSAAAGVARRADDAAGSRITWLRGFDQTTGIQPGGMYLGRQQGVRGIGVNMTEDMNALGRFGVFTVVAHGSADATQFYTHRAAGRAISPREMASTMVDGGYRGGDVMLASCETACSRLPLQLRAELDGQLAARGETARVGTIAAPTHDVRGDGRVDAPGHWRLFDADTQPYSHSTGTSAASSGPAPSSGSTGYSSDVWLVGGAAAAGGVALIAGRDEPAPRPQPVDDDEDEDD
jgi:Flp pilus assembly pilin Flp